MKIYLIWLIGVIVWLAWHVGTHNNEAEELKRLSRKAPGSNAHKNNIAEW